MGTIHSLFLILIIGLCVFFTGCVETGSRTTSYGSSTANVTIIEHSYFFGNDGFFTTDYDIIEYLNGMVSNERKDLNQAQKAVILNKYLD